VKRSTRVPTALFAALCVSLASDVHLLQIEILFQTTAFLFHWRGYVAKNAAGGRTKDFVKNLGVDELLPLFNALSVPQGVQVKNKK
jgi:hypothetical protein